MRVKRDQITGTALVLLGLVIAWLVSQFRIDFKPEYPGPKLFPLIAVFGFVACGLGIFIKSTVSGKEEKVFMVKSGWIRVGAAGGILVLYVFMMTWLGYLIVTPFAVFFLTGLFAQEKKSAPLSRVVFALLFSFVVYAVYVYAFGLSLPRGSVFY
jgi:hypothetical protein